MNTAAVNQAAFCYNYKFEKNIIEEKTLEQRRDALFEFI